MEQNRKPRNKSMNLWTINSRQRTLVVGKSIAGKTVSSRYGGRNIAQLHVKEKMK